MVIKENLPLPLVPDLRFKETSFMEVSKNRLSALIVVIAAFLVQVGTWFVFYPLAGYSDVTLLIAQLAFLVLGIGLMFVFRVGWRTIGIGGKEFVRAAGGILVSYGLLLVVLLLLNALGAAFPIFRQQYQLYAFANNWLLTGFGEELVFAGVLFNLIARCFAPRRRWAAVLLTAVSFSLWHLPGYIAVGLRMGTLGPGLAFDLLLNAVSWGFFGAIYLLSGNLWLTAFAHASTDYALLPVVTNTPILGLLFMVITLIVARWLGRNRPQTTDDRLLDRIDSVLNP
jgi:membrane protease YdiL (CAAX protease family)